MEIKYVEKNFLGHLKPSSNCKLEREPKEISALYDYIRNTLEVGVMILICSVLLVKKLFLEALLSIPVACWIGTLLLEEDLHLNIMISPEQQEHSHFFFTSQLNLLTQ